MLYFTNNFDYIPLNRGPYRDYYIVWTTSSSCYYYYNKKRSAGSKDSGSGASPGSELIMDDKGSNFSHGSADLEDQLALLDLEVNEDDSSSTGSLSNDGRDGAGLEIPTKIDVPIAAGWPKQRAATVAAAHSAAALGEFGNGMFQTLEEDKILQATTIHNNTITN